MVHGLAQEVAAALRIVFDSGVVAGGHGVSADLAGHAEQFVKLDVVVAKSAGQGRASAQVFGDEGPHDGLLEALLKVHDIERKIEVLGDAAGVIEIVGRTAAAFGAHRERRIDLGQAALVPKLHGEADDATVLREQQGRRRGAVHTAAHADDDEGSANGVKDGVCGS